MESVIYDNSKYIRCANGKDYTYLLSHFKNVLPDIHYIKNKHKIQNQIILPVTHALYFDSKFECGNLAQAVQINQTTYSLTLHQDDADKRDKQWFYFAVHNLNTSNELSQWMKYDSLLMASANQKAYMLRG